MDCYACGKEAPQRCSRCGNPYCNDHGDDPAAGAGQALCADCLSPINAAPSGTLFRVSLLGLLVVSVLALWLLIRPPGLPGEPSPLVVPENTPAPVTPGPTASPTPEAPTPEATPTPEPKPTATPTPEPEGPIEYTVVDGDTISGIAAAFGVTVEDLLAVNGLTEEEALLIQPGEVLVIPQ